MTKSMIDRNDLPEGEPRSSRTARAAVLIEPGSPVLVQSFHIPGLRSGEVHVDIELGGVCGTDAHIAGGYLPVPLPLILGHEAVGRVAETGGTVRDALGVELRAGDLVTWASSIPCGHCSACALEGEHSLCESRLIYGINQPAQGEHALSGGWAERIILRPGSTIVKVPDGVTAEEVISLGCAGPTVVHGMLRIARPRAGDVVVVQGAGPVGLAAAIYARLSGARRIILVGGPAERLRLASQMGLCDAIVDVTTTSVEERAALVLAETPGGRGADLVVEATGVPTAVAEGIDLTRRNGTYLVVGQYTDHGPTLINPHLITKKQLRVLGSWAFSGSHTLEYVQSLPIIAKQFDLRRLVTTFSLDEVADAMSAMREGRIVKAALRRAEERRAA